MLSQSVNKTSNMATTSSTETRRCKDRFLLCKYKNNNMESDVNFILKAAFCLPLKLEWGLYFDLFCCVLVVTQISACLMNWTTWEMRMSSSRPCCTLAVWVTHSPGMQMSIIAWNWMCSLTMAQSRRCRCIRAFIYRHFTQALGWCLA